MRRSAPRPIRAPVERTVRQVAPATPLARVQRAWPAVAGEQVARETEPVSERDGVVTVACRSAVWAQELELMSSDLLSRLNAPPEAAARERPIRRLRFVTRTVAGGS